MNYERMLLASLRRADLTYGLIEKGDKLLLGISGGKDSMALATILKTYQMYKDKDFTFKACFLDLGFPNTDISLIVDYFKKIDVELIISDNTSVYPILKQHMTSANILPCSICSRMKKAAINAVSNQLGYKKVAFAHHADDAIETLFMNMTRGGRIATFAPKMHLERADITFVRPLIYAREKDIIGYVKEKGIPVLKSTCGNDSTSFRAEVKKTLNDYYKANPDVYDNAFTLLTNYEKFDMWFDKAGYSDGEGLFIKRVIDFKEYQHVISLRKEVFVKEQHIDYESEYDDGSDDDSCTYFLGYYYGKPVATLRLKKIDDEHYVLGRFAVLKDYRSKKIGSKLLTYIEKQLSQRHCPVTITSHAQERALDFYLKNGYVIDGPQFEEAGIIHLPISKTIYKPIMDKEKKKNQL